MTFSFTVICLSLVLFWYALDEQYHNRFFFVSNSDSASSANMARRPPASANPASAHFLAKPHFHPNVTFGDFTGTHPRARIGFRREFLPGTCTVHRTSHSPFPDTWSFSFSRNGPCRPSAFCRLRLKRHASRNPSLHGHYPLRRYYGSIRLLPPARAGQVSQVPVQNCRNAPCPYAPSRRARRKTTSARPCWLPLS